MKNIRTSVSEYMNYCRHNKFSANTSVNLGENDKVNHSIIFLIEIGYEVRNVIENKLINR